MGLKRNPFQQHERQIPVHFPYKINIKYVSSISLPENFIVESIPEKIEFHGKNSIGTFFYEAKNIGNTIVVSYLLKIEKENILPEDYPDLKAMYEHAVSKGTKKIVLKKL